MPNLMKPNLRRIPSNIAQNIHDKTILLGSQPHHIMDKSSTKDISFSEIKQLYFQRRVSVVLAIVFAFLGIFLGVVSTEVAVISFMDALQVQTEASKPKLLFMHYIKQLAVKIKFLRWAISVSTFILVIMIIWDFILCRQIQVLEKNLPNFTHACTNKAISILLLELIVCAVHPMPLNYDILWPNPGQQVYSNVREAPLEIILNMLMFLRIYLVARVMILFSRFKRDSTSHSIAKINRVRLNYIFVFKSYMNLYPTRILIGCATVTFLWAAWAVRVCEMTNLTGLRDGYLKNLWFIGVTFLTIGYGDVIPDTICGKTISIGTGIVGVCFTAMVIAVLSRKLEMSRPEKRMQEFLMEAELNSRIQNFAAEVIGWTWKKYRARNLASLYKLSCQTNFIAAVNKFRKLRIKKFYLQEKSLSFVDISHENERLERILLETQRLIKEMRSELKLMSGNDKRT